EQEYADYGNNSMPNDDFQMQVQHLEIKMVQMRATSSIKAAKLGFRVPYPWAGPMPNWYSPQEKIDFVSELIPQISEWNEEMEAYQYSVEKPCQW
ncbi:hypothetical protein KI387_042087, partial [Taxus chinensis]